MFHAFSVLHKIIDRESPKRYSSVVHEIYALYVNGSLRVMRVLHRTFRKHLMQDIMETHIKLNIAIRKKEIINSALESLNHYLDFWKITPLSTVYMLCIFRAETS